MKTLVTGADGLLGNNVVRELLARNHAVRAFLEPGRPLSTLEGLDIEVNYGDLLAIDDVEDAVEGCDAIIHCAGLTHVWPAKNPACMRVNMQGTRHIVQAALKKNVARMVHVSSASVFAYGTMERPGDEQTLLPEDHFELDYIRSKAISQELVLDAVQRAGLPAVIVNPTFMIGPFDARPSSGAMILAYVNRKLPGFSSGGKNFIHVKDSAVAICNALTRGEVGSCYILGNQNLTFRSFFGKVAKITGLPPIKRYIPEPFIKLYGFWGSIYGALTGKPPVLSYPMAKLSIQHQYFSPAKARAELGLPQTPIEMAIADAVHWFVDHEMTTSPINLAAMAKQIYEANRPEASMQPT